jgi:hypothetical protein
MRTIKEIVIADTGIRAQYNPDYRGGPTFESADELIDDLHKNAR